MPRYVRSLAIFDTYSLANATRKSAASSTNISEAEAEGIAREVAIVSYNMKTRSPLVGITDEMHPHPVALAVAPGQTSFVPVIPISQPDRIRRSNKSADSCFYFPKFKSSVCSGQREV